jgi:quinol-cytochrome oxidoreductase complex cytochrome b subunit
VVLITIGLLTGGLLARYYLPTVEDAQASVGTILRDVDFGWFVHQIHFWGGQALLAFLILRVVRFFIQGVYKPPRELTWVIATLLLLVCLHSDLTGRLLPMTSEAYWSSVRALEIAGKVPVYGWLIQFLVGGGGTYISDLSMIRFYILHIALLPGAAIVLIYLHFSGVRRLGLADDRRQVAQRKLAPGKSPIREQFLTLAILLVLLFGVLVSLAVLAPTPLQGKADPYSTLPGVGPPWYLLAPFGLLELTSRVLPGWVAGSLLFIAFAAFVAVPFLDRSQPGTRLHRVVLWLGFLVFVLWVALTFYGAGVV